MSEQGLPDGAAPGVEPTIPPDVAKRLLDPVKYTGLPFGRRGVRDAATDTDETEPEAAPEVTQAEARPEATLQEVGSALLALDRELGGEMDLRIVPTGTGDDVTTTILLGDLEHIPTEPGKPVQYRAYGVNNRLGLVYFVDNDAHTREGWDQDKLILKGDGTLEPFQLQRITTPEEMKRWEDSIQKTRMLAERNYKRKQGQTEFERSLPQRAMDVLTPKPTNPQPPI